MDGSVERALAGFAYEEPFASVLGSHNGSMVDLRGHYSNSWQQLITQFHGLVTDMRHDP
jgi:hypothetical protein